MMSVFDKIKNWYEGDYHPYEDSPDSNVTLIGGQQVYSPSARIARCLVGFWLKHWKFIITTAVALLAVAVTALGVYLALQGEPSEKSLPLREIENKEKQPAQTKPLPAASPKEDERPTETEGQGDDEIIFV